MRVGRPRVLGLLFPLLVLAGCTPADTSARARGAGAALPSYAPPSGAPAFCAELAGTTHLTGLPVTLGTLFAHPDNVEARLELTAAAAELQDVLDDVGDRPAIVISLRRLVAALRQAQDGPLSDDVRRAIATNLDEAGRQTQAVCDFPA